MNPLDDREKLAAITVPIEMNMNEVMHVMFALDQLIREKGMVAIGKMQGGDPRPVQILAEMVRLYERLKETLRVQTEPPEGW